jgi:hypothetical protein
MANKIKPKRSYTASSVPLTSDLDTHELAINWVDGKAFTKDASGNIVSVTLGGGSFTLPTASSSTLGGVRVGSGLSISSGVLSASDSRWDLFLPPAPTSVTATPGNAQAAVSWTAPTGVLAQTPITDYTVQYSSNSGSSWTTFSRSASTATSATVTGLTNGTAYTFRVSATNAVGTGSYSTASSSITAGGDPYFSSVVLLLHADGSGSSFVDSSASPKTLTAYGNATQSSTQSKWGGKSAAFDGNGDYLSATLVPNIGTDDFVLEWWQRVNNVSDYQHVLGTSTNGNFMVALLAPYNGAGAIGVGRNNIAWDFVRNATLVNNTWQHVAISRSSGTIRMYVDGALVGSSASNSQNYAIGTIQIGAQASGSSAGLNGYIDDLRLTVGSARSYTGSTITVGTAAHPDS